MHGINKAENVHYWQNIQNQICISIENVKRFLTFDNIDHAINWLFMNGYKESARQLNKHKKESSNG